MAYNSVSDIPSMFFLLFLSALYAFRKNYSGAYRVLSFFVVYYIQVLMLIKICNDFILRSPFNKEWIAANPKAAFVRIEAILFGEPLSAKVHLSDRDQASADRKFYIYQASAISCLFFTQCWKVTKWIEIRYKTSHLENAWFCSRFVEYINMRKSADVT